LRTEQITPDNGQTFTSRELYRIAGLVYALKMGVPSPAPAAPADKTGPPRLSLVVLPFTNIGGDPEHEDLSMASPRV
jgi:hypothetical protein